MKITGVLAIGGGVALQETRTATVESAVVIITKVVLVFLTSKMIVSIDASLFQ